MGLLSAGITYSNESKDTAMHAECILSIEGVDISEQVNRNLETLSYTDNEEDATDDLQIKLHDAQGQWLQKWLNDALQAAARGKQPATKNDTFFIQDTRASIRKNLYLGIRCYDAMIAQIYLSVLGYFSGTINGIVGADSIRAIKAFQKDRGIHQTDQMDKDTWIKLTNTVQGKNCKQYTCYFIARTNVQIYQRASTSSPKVAVIEKNKECIITDKVASGWYAISYGSYVGFAHGSNLDAVRTEYLKPLVHTNTKGLTIQAGVRLYEPSGAIKQMSFGMFELDSVNASGAPSTVTIKGTSLPYGSGIRTEARDKAWEGYTLQKIGQEIAQKAGLGFFFDCPADPYYRRIEQAKATDIAFLQELCHKAGFALKVADKKLIIFDQARYESLQEIEMIEWMDGSYTKYDLSTSEGDVHYDMCTVKYYHPGQKKLIQATAKADDYDASNENCKILMITNERVESVSEAQILAYQELRMHNKYEKKAAFTMRGNPLLCAGVTIRLRGFGLWDNKYIIKQCRHEIGSNGYTTKITLRTIPLNTQTTDDVMQQAATSNKSGNSTSSQISYWELSSSTTIYNKPPNETGSRPLGTKPAGTPVTPLGSTSKGYTYVNVSGLTGYVATGKLRKVYQ